MQPIHFPEASWHDWHDETSRRTWRVWQYRPAGPAPDGGFPALLLLDGNAYFPLAAQWAHVQQTRPAYVRREPCAVIGIGHPGDTLLDAPARRRDYTPPAPATEPPEGGAEQLLDFLQHTLLPKLADALTLDRSRCGLFGHSLGGLFALHTLFSRPALFSSYYAASPSIWWHDAWLLQEQTGFMERRGCAVPEAGAAGPLPDGPGLDSPACARAVELFLYAGEMEEPGLLPGAGPAEAGSRHSLRRQVSRATEMAASLSALQWPGLRARFRLWPELTHGDTVVPSLMDALAHTGRPPPAAMPVIPGS